MVQFGILDSASDPHSVLERAVRAEELGCDDFYSFESVTVTPRPVQQPRIPIWVGAQLDPAMERAARLADGCDQLVVCTGEEVTTEMLELFTREVMPAFH